MFVSYAQNQEDVVLHRLLRDVPAGRYVDVGAGHPVHDNVTHALHLAGWRGIDVEPMAREAELLRAARPDDVVIQAALGAAAGEVELFEAPLENRGATTADPAVVRRYCDAGQTFRAFISPVRTLDDVLAEHHSGELHLVKIDVEGAELEVLRGFDLVRHRPWVMVVEATEPNSTVGSAHRWEHLLLQAGYSCTLFDGLNRFYVRNDLPGVAALLSTPANVFDRWITHQVDGLRHELQNAAEHIANLEHSLGSAEAYAASLLERAERAEEYARSLIDRGAERHGSD